MTDSGTRPHYAENGVAIRRLENCRGFISNEERCRSVKGLQQAVCDRQPSTASGQVFRSQAEGQSRNNRGKGRHTVQQHIVRIRLQFGICLRHEQNNDTGHFAQQKYYDSRSARDYADLNADQWRCNGSRFGAGGRTQILDTAKGKERCFVT